MCRCCGVTGVSGVRERRRRRRLLDVGVLFVVRILLGVAIN